MLRAHDLARQLLSLKNNPVIVLFDSLGYPVSVQLEPLQSDYALFIPEHTAVIAPDRNTTNAALAALRKTKND